MKANAFGLVGLLAALAGAVQAVPRLAATELRITRPGTHSSVTGSAQNFTGTVRVAPLFSATAPARASGATVTFEPGARSAWHSHPLGQTLIVTSGIGRVQSRGGAVHEIRPGDVVWTPPGVQHWHGAAPATAMSHIAIQEVAAGTAVEWLEQVTDAQYSATIEAEALAMVAASPSARASNPASAMLSAKQQAIPLMATFMATADMVRLSAALNQGLDAGMTIAESKEVLVQLYAYVGFPKSLNALGELFKVVEARKQRGIVDVLGREPQGAIPTGKELITAGKANQTKISGGPVKGPVFDFAPVINTFLQAHLFGDIFERDNLDWQSRELATVGALAATPGVQVQLRSHMLASMRVGLSAAQLQQLVQLLADQGETDAAKRANESLTQALATLSGGKF